ncbi:hypothetical protein GQ55_5G393900 [Panicum hallii var. hallii]|uniref:Uncharacterized protein n=1 Tax=Panicum hallii var. hallii TaxID=1504633 RepID=A0A2T7DN60_9POAL|nr:hypothetical protein GQ55_5G393900 [Panicum hallii var. hallii]
MCSCPFMLHVYSQWVPSPKILIVQPFRLFPSCPSLRRSSSFCNFRLVLRMLKAKVVFRCLKSQPTPNKDNSGISFTSIILVSLLSFRSWPKKLSFQKSIISFLKSFFAITAENLHGLTVIRWYVSF